MKFVIPAGEGRALSVSNGQSVRLSTPKGHQAADFFPFQADDVLECLSAPATWTATRDLKPREGTTFFSNRRRAMLELMEDGADGVHDMLLAACDLERYHQLGVEGWHASCAENLVTAMHSVGHKLAAIPQPVNFFTYSCVLADQSFETPPNPVQPGSYVVLRARMDLICVVCACPFDLPMWEINAGNPTELQVEVFA